MINKQALIIRKADSEKLGTIDKVKEAKASVAAEAGSAGEDYIKANMPDNVYQDVEGQSNVFTELKAGTIDCGVVDITMAGSMIEAPDSDFSDLMIVELPDAESEYYSIGFRKDSKETVERVNEALMELFEDGTIKKIAEKYGLADVIVDLASEYGEKAESTALESGASGEITKAIETTVEETAAETTAEETAA